MQINSPTKTINTNSVQSELNIIANITDNQAIYRCEAQNSATDVPLRDSKTLSVHCELLNCVFYDRFSSFLSPSFALLSLAVFSNQTCIAHNFSISRSKRTRAATLGFRGRGSTARHQTRPNYCCHPNFQSNLELRES